MTTTLDAVMTAVPGIVLRLNRAGRVLECSGRLLRDPGAADQGIGAAAPSTDGPGKRPEQATATGALVGHPIAAFCGATLAPRYLAALETALRDGRPVTFDHAVDGPAGPAAWEARFVPTPPDECVVVVQEVTDRGGASDRLRRRSAQLARGMEALQSLAAMGNADTQAFLAAAVEAAARVLGVARVAIWLRSDDRRQLTCHLMADGGRAGPGSGMVLEAATIGRYLDALASCRVLAGDDVMTDTRFTEMRDVCSAFGISSMLDVPIRVEGELIGMVCHAHVGPARSWSLEESNFAASIADVVANALQGAKRRDLEARLRQSQKMEAIGVLAGGVAHDFNNVLTAILGYTTLAQGQLRRDDPLQEHLDEVRKAAEWAAALTRQLLAFGRKQVLQPRLVEVGEVVSGIEPMLRRVIGEDIRFQSRIATRATVHADPSQIEQVLLNLVVNAREAMPKGGTLSIAVFDEEADAGGQGVAGPRLPGVVLEVADTGIGMDEETRQRIFEPFFTTKEVGKGTGLGLAMVYGIVQQSGGRIAVESEIGQGTVFRIVLPAATGEPIRSPAADEPAAVTLPAGISILLVEDDALVRDLTADMLERSGCRVRTASSGYDALRVVHESPDAFDLVLSDIVMPDLDGRDLGHLLAESRPGLRILYMSGYAGKVPLPAPQEGMVVDFIEKTFRPEGLLTKIQSILATPCPGDRGPRYSAV
ncbi:MAG: ATP-binding protein [Gemmatimonadales bacterium]|nr:ATP-binding protein [Gemmatimonadales bacterium]